MVDEYLDHAFAYNANERVTDRKTGEIDEPNEETMGKLESAIGIAEPLRKQFRAEVATFVARQRNEQAEEFRYITWDSHPRLKEAVKRVMFQSVKGFTRVVSHSGAMNPEDTARYDAMVEKMISELGYCPLCVDVVLRFAKNHNLFDAD